MGIIDIKRRIKSVQSTRKVTKAMQMVSAAKMKKAQSLAVSSRTYAEAAWGLIQNIANTGSFENPLVKTYPRAKKIGIIILTTNRGLVGSLNTNVLTQLRILSESLGETIAEIITYGKKGNQTLSRMKKTIIADFLKEDKTISAEEIYPIAQMISQMYASGEYKKVYIVYNQFISTLVQKPYAKQIFPFREALRKDLTEDTDELAITDTEYIYEPDPKIVLEHLLPRIIESQIYEAILESNASEHSARMVMMKNATESAGDLISDLTLTYNGLRQGKITTELSEITAGRIALE
jgi:F-type H+-transporting ATPase subunit gamma